MIDINPNYCQGTMLDRLNGDRAITESALYNLLNTTPGDYSKIFNADIGSFWRVYLQEPLSDSTAGKIELEIINSITKWLPKIKIMRGSSYVHADFSLPGYRVCIRYVASADEGSQSGGTLKTVSFDVPL